VSATFVSARTGTAKPGDLADPDAIEQDRGADFPAAGQLLLACDLGALYRSRAARMRHQIRPKKGQSFAVDAQQPERNAVNAGNKIAPACKNKYAPSQAGE
jgi:hypothetical protein